MIIGFSLPTREAAGEHDAGLTAASYTGRHPPLDAFWVPGMRSWPIPTAMTSGYERPANHAVPGHLGVPGSPDNGR